MDGWSIRSLMLLLAWLRLCIIFPPLSLNVVVADLSSCSWSWIPLLSVIYSCSSRHFHMWLKVCQMVCIELFCDDVLFLYTLAYASPFMCSGLDRLRYISCPPVVFLVFFILSILIRQWMLQSQTDGVCSVQRLQDHSTGQWGSYFTYYVMRLKALTHQSDIRERAAIKPDCCITSRLLCFCQKAALEHTLTTTADGPKTCTVSTCLKRNTSENIQTAAKCHEHSCL